MKYAFGYTLLTINFSKVANKQLAQTEPNPENRSLGSSNKPNFLDPEKVIKNYYSGINERDYQTTWKKLSSDFQGISGSFSDYTQWWNSVRKVEINSTRLIRSDSTQAVVKVALQYFMEDGQIIDDKGGRFYLNSNVNSYSWELAKKSSHHPSKFKKNFDHLSYELLSRFPCI